MMLCDDVGGWNGELEGGRAPSELAPGPGPAPFPASARRWMEAETQGQGRGGRRPGGPFVRSGPPPPPTAAAAPSPDPRRAPALVTFPGRGELYFRTHEKSCERPPSPSRRAQGAGLLGWGGVPSRALVPDLGENGRGGWTPLRPLRGGFCFISVCESQNEQDKIRSQTS